MNTFIVFRCVFFIFLFFQLPPAIAQRDNRDGGQNEQKTEKIQSGQRHMQKQHGQNHGSDRLHR